MADAPNHADVKEMNFETALQQLETIVDQLERGDVPSTSRSRSTSAAKPCAIAATSC